MECRILIHNSDLELFDWCQYDPDNSMDNKSGVATAEELKKYITGCQRVIAFLPQQDVLLKAHKFPQKANKQQLNAIAYSIEDSLGQDIEDCFFSTGQESEEHIVPVAVISREKMDTYAEFFSSQLINVNFIIPEVYLCPWSEDEELLMSICPHKNGYLLRFGEHSGTFCEAPALQQIVKIISSSKSSQQNRIDAYMPDDKLEALSGLAAMDAPDDTLEALSGLAIKDVNIRSSEAIDLLSQGLNLSGAINLKQKEYRSSYQAYELIKQWNWPIMSALLLLLVFMASQLLETSRKDQLLQLTYQKQLSLLQQYLPTANAEDNPKQQLIKALAAAQNGKGNTGFIELMHEYVKLKSTFNALKTNRVQYQQSKLVVNLESRDLSSLELFRSKLGQSKFSATIEDVSISPEKTTGRLVMQDS